jgi:hypothetical protein
MSAALFDPDDIMREVRAKTNLSPAAKPANLLTHERARGLPLLLKLLDR